MMDPTQCQTKKLVTVCTTDLSRMLQPFTYKGYSRSEHTNVEMSIPANEENLMFYEHYRQSPDFDPNPERLSFMYLGGNAKGEIVYDFHSYTKVTIVDISHHFASISSIFNIVSQLPTCRELRIFLSQNNIVATDAETRIISQKSFPFPYASKTVKRFRITEDGEIDQAIFNGAATRFEYFLDFVSAFFPNLESFIIDGMGGRWKIYDYISNFVKFKRGLPRHNVMMKRDGKISCQPAKVYYHHQNRHSRTSLQYPRSSSSFDKTTNQENDTDTDATINTRDPRLMKRKIHVVAKKNEGTEGRSRRDSIEIIEVRPPRKSTPPVITISDDDEEESHSPKQLRIENQESNTASPCMSLPAAVSETPTNSSGICALAPQANGSCSALLSIGSTYWEASSNDGENRRFKVKVEKNPCVSVNAQVEVSADQISRVASQIPMNEDYFRDILRTATSECSRVIKSENIQSNASTIEGTQRKYITCNIGNFVFERLKRKQ